MENRSINIFYWIWLIIIIGGIIEIVLGVLSLVGIRYWILPDTPLRALLLIAMGILLIVIAIYTHLSSTNLMIMSEEFYNKRAVIILSTVQKKNEFLDTEILNLVHLH